MSNFIGAYTYYAQVSSYRSAPITVYWSPLGSTTSAPAGSPSSACDSGLTVNNGTISGAYVKVLVLTTPTETSLCYRVDTAGTGRGGRIVVQHGVPDVDVDTIGVPTVEDVEECTVEPGNQLGIPHPIADTETLVGHVYLDAYVNTSVAASLCYTLEGQGKQVTVPMSLPGISTDPNIDVDNYADPA